MRHTSPEVFTFFQLRRFIAELRWRIGSENHCVTHPICHITASPDYTGCCTDCKREGRPAKLSLQVQVFASAAKLLSPSGFTTDGSTDVGKLVENQVHVNDTKWTARKQTTNHISYLPPLISNSVS